MTRIAITSASFSKEGTLVEQLKNKFDHIKTNPSGKVLSENDLIPFLENADAAIIGLDQITLNVLDACPRLKFISKYGVGLDNIDQPACEKKGVKIGWTGGINKRSVSEMALGFMISLCRNLYTTSQSLSHGSWIKNGGYQLTGKTVGIIGVGNIGYSVAKKCKALGMNVIGVSRHGKTLEDVDEMVSTDQLDTVLPKADYIFMATPNTTETNNLLDERRQSLMKPGVGIVNVGRAATMDYEALVDNLNSGHIGAAIIDVFDPEPLPKNSPLWSAPNLMVMPHISADDGDTYIVMTLELVFRNIRRYLANQELKNLVRPDLGY